MVEATSHRRAPALRCPACHGGLLAEQPVLSCPEGHAAIHEDCLELCPRCPALGCGAALAEGGSSTVHSSALDPAIGRALLLGGEVAEAEDALARGRVFGLGLLLVVMCSLGLGLAALEASAWSAALAALIPTQLLLGAALAGLLFRRWRATRARLWRAMEAHPGEANASAARWRLAQRRLPREQREALRAALSELDDPAAQLRAAELAQALAESLVRDPRRAVSPTGRPLLGLGRQQLLQLACGRVLARVFQRRASWSARPAALTERERRWLAMAGGTRSAQVAVERAEAKARACRRAGSAQVEAFEALVTALIAEVEAGWGLSDAG